jgi:hypothetical protein
MHGSIADMLLIDFARFGGASPSFAVFGRAVLFGLGSIEAERQIKRAVPLAGRGATQS